MNTSNSIGRLKITRCFHESFYLRIDPHVNRELTAQDLFRNPVQITILPSLVKKKQANALPKLAINQIAIVIEADKRINIVREELITHSTSQKKVIQPDISLADVFLDVANNELSTKDFLRLLRLSQRQLKGNCA
ncbi:MAG: hypothetical protein L3K25_07815 [Gammaproteobacteria bacterium]|nr:hypothetical protein [Gammaproteobacteria bacterium]